MAIIGFIFLFCVMCLFTLLVTYLVLAPEPFGLSKSERLYGLIGYALVGFGWYWLFSDVTISIGGV